MSSWYVDAVLAHLAESEGVSCVSERNPTARETDLIVTMRPRAYHVRTSVSDLALEDSRFALDIVRSHIERSARMCRGQVIADTAEREFDLPHNGDRMIAPFLSMMERSTSFRDWDGEFIVDRLSSILCKLAPDHVRERLAIKLMEGVERLGK